MIKSDSEFLGINKGLEEIAVMANELSKEETTRILRFNVCDTGLYRWSSIKTNSILISRFLCACWNNRRAIAALIEYHSKENKDGISS